MEFATEITSEARGDLLIVFRLLAFYLSARCFGRFWHFRKQPTSMWLVLALASLVLAFLPHGNKLGLYPSILTVALGCLAARQAFLDRGMAWQSQVMAWPGVFLVATVASLSSWGVFPMLYSGPSMWPNASAHMGILWFEHESSHEYQRGDRVVFRVEGRDGLGWPTGNYHKRVVGRPGDVVEIFPDRIEINHEVWASCPKTSIHADYTRWLCPHTNDDGRQSYVMVWGDPSIWMLPYQRWELGPGEWFVLGDNLPVSGDSRDFGPISSSWILGRPAELSNNLANTRILRHHWVTDDIVERE